MARLSRRQLIFCPICYHSSNKCLGSSFIDPVFATNGSKYTFLEVLDVFLHLHHAHRLDAPVTETSVGLVNTYRIRGDNGLVLRYLQDVWPMSSVRTRRLQYYWDEPSRTIAYNRFAAEASTSRQGNIRGVGLDVSDASLSLRSWQKLTGNEVGNDVGNEEEEDYVFMYESDFKISQV